MLTNENVIISEIIQKAVSEEPPQELGWLYQEFYSPYYNFMRLLAETIKEGALVELGVHKGRGLASLAFGNPDLPVIGYDTVRCPEIDFILPEFKNIKFFKRASLPPTIRRKISLLHIDTEHSYAMAKAEFEAYKPYLLNGAYVLFDDLHAMDDQVLEYFNELPYYKIQDDRLHPICGYGVLIYEG